jgi:predicted Co/Zn/Cd cation transporter (cation efflux family)
MSYVNLHVLKKIFNTWSGYHIKFYFLYLYVNPTILILLCFLTKMTLIIKTGLI